MQDEGDSRFWLPPVDNGKPQVLTKARKARGDVTEEPGDSGGVSYTVNDPLAYYLSHRRLDGAQVRAGKRLYSLWYRSPFRDRYVTMRFEEAVEREAVAGMPISSREYIDAVMAISGDAQRRVTLDVCCRGEWAGRKLAHLKSGLDDLARHFKKLLDTKTGKC